MVKIQKFKDLNNDGHYTMTEESSYTPQQVTAFGYLVLFLPYEVYFNIPNSCWLVETSKGEFWQVFPNGYTELEAVMAELSRR